MKKTKIFAAYLPQYHETEENNLFWGKGFTDWVGVKKCEPQFEGHDQPRIPLNNNYYDLSNYKTIEWQAQLAKKYLVDGFCIYHYWFENGKSVLDKPAKLILKHTEIDISYFFCWDNSSWIRSWSNISGNAWAPQFDNISQTETNDIYLLKHSYGEKLDWKKHFDWLLPFFRDDRYFKINGSPVFAFFRVDDKIKMTEMANYWKELARENGLPGLYLITGVGPFRNKHCLDAQFKYEPMGVWDKKKAINRRIGILTGKKGNSVYSNIWDYNKAWKVVLRQSKRFLKKNVYMSGFVRYDDTPRRGKKANVIIGETPKLFKKYFSEFYSLNQKYNKDFVLLTAWNEWGEGAYLEPDEMHKYGYLEQLRNGLSNL